MKNNRMIIISLIFVSMLIVPVFAADWSMFKNDASHSGYTADVVNPPLTLKWTKALGFETDSSPVIVNDVLYIGTTFGIHALDAGSGEEIWTFPTNGFVNSVPAVSNDAVYFGADDRKFYALNATDGTLLWVNDTAMDGYTASAALTNNMVYAMPKDGSFYAFNPGNGKIIWSKLIGKVAESSPAAGEGIIAFGTDGGDIVALDASTGKEKWRYDIGEIEIKSSPVIADGTVFVGSNDGSVYAFTTEKGTLKWKYSTSNNVVSSPSVKNGVVYFGSTDSNFFALDALTGKVIWKFPDSGSVLGGPAISNDIVYFGTRNNFIYALDANSGKMLWKNSTGENDKDYITSPAISGNMLFAATHSGILFGYSSGTTSTPVVKETIASPTVTQTASPTAATVKPSQTKGSPGFEFPVSVLLILAVFGIYHKKK
ncbi:MAG: PQQ-binding-like beta-propeller repeat protein [Candidatus Methanoperedens sp.]